MKELWNELVTTLTEMLELYKAILEVSREKQSILVHGKAKELEAINQKEELLILGVGKLENLREGIVQKIANAEGLSREKANLTHLKEVAEIDIIERIEYISTEFGKVITELEPINKLNTELIKQALVFINYNINLLAQNAADPIYAPQGKAQQASSSSKTLFDQKV